MSIMDRVSVLGILPAVGLILLTGTSVALCQSQTPAAQTATPVSPQTIVLTIGEKSFTAAEFEQIVSALPPQFRATMASLGKKGFAEQFADLYGLAMEGEKRQLDQGEEFQGMLEFERRVLLAQVTLNASKV